MRPTRFTTTFAAGSALGKLAACFSAKCSVAYKSLPCCRFLFVEFFLPTVLIYIVLRALSTSLLRFGSLALYGLEVGLELAIDGGLLVFEELFE